MAASASPASLQRAAGFAARQRRNSSGSHAGSARSSSSGSGSGRGGRPNNISCTRTPTANISSRGVAGSSSSQRPGPTYAGAHSAAHAEPTAPAVSERPTALTIPASAIRLRPSVTNTFSGRRSPWATSAACAAARASSTSRSVSTARASGTAPLFCSHARRVVPSTNGRVWYTKGPARPARSGATSPSWPRRPTSATTSRSNARASIASDSARGSTFTSRSGPPAAGGDDPADTDALVGLGEALEVLPRGGITLQGSHDVGGDLRAELPLRVALVIEDVADAGEPRPGHALRRDQAAHALAVHRRQDARGLARREALRVAARVNRLQETVDPAVAERFLDGVVVGDARLAAVLLIVDQPDLGGGAVVLGEPRAPFFAVLGVEGFAEDHGASPPSPPRSLSR